ncbi:MAG: histidine phosphatase family protein [Oligoflexus sp.]
MYKIRLIRHPKVAIKPGTCYGRLDVPLQEGWQETARKLRCQFSGSLVITSPASRCEIFAKQLADTYYVDDRLQELNFGGWEGIAWDTIERKSFDQWSANYIGRPTPGGESYLQLFHRTVNCICEWSQQSSDLSLVTHGGVIRACLSWFYRRKLSESLVWNIPFSTVFFIELDHEWRIKSYENALYSHSYPTITNI